MRVGTDGVLLGAWAGQGRLNHILDVGTGTGLIALMMAQRFPVAKVDALDIDDKAVVRAKENASVSLWSDRISIYHSSFQEFIQAENHQYDLIVSNPPFFHRAFKPPDLIRHIARHDDRLPAEVLFERSSELLSRAGLLALVLPYLGHQQILELAAKHDFHPSRVLFVRPVPHKEFNRILIEFSRKPGSIERNEITIEEHGRHKYSRDYIALTKDFYLNM